MPNADLPDGPFPPPLPSGPALPRDELAPRRRTVTTLTDPVATLVAVDRLHRPTEGGRTCFACGTAWPCTTHRTINGEA